ncbi:MAG: DUF3347 domain-containing protein, partial [Planctomycetes bacterium]|nr:DUF3347 domain-containing protein [Planctomycetota bacterium]
GHRAGDYYIVHHGLKLDEEVVKVGSFKIDSSLQILARPSMMSPAELSDDPAAVPAVFRTRLTPIFQTYLVAGGALAADDPATARTAVIRLIELAKQAAETEAKEKLLAPDVRSNWTTVNDRIIFAAHEMLDAKTVPAMRDRFGPLSDSMIRLVKTAGHALPSEMVEFRCKVAREGREGRWLQTDRTIRNPHFGTIRLDCGQQMTTYPSRPPLAIAAEFRREMLPVYDAYLTLQQALTYDRLDEARAAWLDMRKAALTVDAKSLAPNAARAWGAIGDQLTESLDENPADFELADFHRPFEAVAGVMLTLADTLGHPYPQPLYQAFCPMAFGDTGAVWLQAKKRPADNPYFVDEMQHCGTVQRTIPPLPSLEPPPSRPAPLQPTEPRP